MQHFFYINKLDFSWPYLLTAQGPFPILLHHRQLIFRSVFGKLEFQEAETQSTLLLCIFSGTKYKFRECIVFANLKVPKRVVYCIHVFYIFKFVYIGISYY